MSTLKVLVVDDSNAVRVRISQILKSARYEVITAADGAEAMEALQRENPTLMILDVNMPRMDGYGVCEQLNRMRAAAPVPPVVFLTSLNSRALELLGSEFGAYMQKPVEPEQLLSVVGEQIEKCA